MARVITLNALVNEDDWVNTFPKSLDSLGCNFPECEGPGPCFYINLLCLPQRHRYASLAAAISTQSDDRSA